MLHDKTICIVGLGYVGLPLAYTFAKKGYEVCGYDVNSKRVRELIGGHDVTDELSDEQLSEVEIAFSDDASILDNADIIIMALPTPIDDNNNPDISILKSASKTVGEHLKKGAIVVYESTVYPGTTEEVCGPILEESSGLTCGEDFTLGYSPERINPGDKKHTVDKIVKVVAGQDPTTTDVLCDLYGSIISAGVHKAESIQVAEMAKAIENAQRDLNIAFINEVAVLCNKIGINTTDVLDAAGTKWNFLRFSPGLVGGHCIGVDPYYLVEKARQLGMQTHVIIAGRAVNDSMGSFVAERILEELRPNPIGMQVLVLGLTFKENIPDTRNSKSGQVVHGLLNAGCTVHVHDAEVDEQYIKKMGYVPGSLNQGSYDAVVLLVPHKEYLEVPDMIIESAKPNGLIYDLKSVLAKQDVLNSGRKYLSL